MKRVICTSLDGIDALAVESCPGGGPLDEDAVRIEVHACGVNYPDTLIVRGAYQFRPPLPFTPGGEVAGVVIGLGANVTHLQVGQRVAAMCLHGGFASEIAVPASAVIPIPEGMTFEIAASFTIAYGTTIHALKQRAQLAHGETVLVLGAAGGVGLAAVEVAKAMGATVIAAASTEEKLSLAIAHGADHAICYSDRDLKTRVKELTCGRGVDVVYDPVGGSYTEAALRSLAWKGRLLVVGFASGQIPSLRANLLLLKGAQALGVFWGDFIQREPDLAAANMHTLFEWHQAGAIRPHLHAVWPLERVKAALRLLQDRAVLGKVVLRPHLPDSE